MNNQIFNALLKEAQFTNEMLRAGVSQIGTADYASKGKYFQAFTSLSTGIERIGKLSLILDHYIDHSGNFPIDSALTNQIGHNLVMPYSMSKEIVIKRSIRFEYLKNLDDQLSQNVLAVLSHFAKGERYSNINLVVGKPNTSDPIGDWFENVDQLILKSYISKSDESKIKFNAQVIRQLLNDFMIVQYTSETGTEITDIQDASYRTGLNTAVIPFRRLAVLKIARYWVELLSQLQSLSMRLRRGDIPFFDEVFAAFLNSDQYFLTDNPWDET